MPYSKRVMDSLGDAGVPCIHFANNASTLLELVAQAGGDVIGVDWRIRLKDAWGLVGHVGIQGNLDPAVMLAPFETIAEAARDILSDADGRPGHIFNLGHGVLPQTPQDALRRLVDLVHEHTLTSVGGR